MVYLALLYSTTRSALSTVPFPAAWPSRSRYCPAITSVRIRSSTAWPRRSASAGRPLAWYISSVHDSRRSPMRMASTCRTTPVIPASAARRGGRRTGGAARPPAGVAAVHDVVVHQRAGVQQLQRGGRGQDLRAVWPARPAPAPVAERGPQPFPGREQLLQRRQRGQQLRARPEQHGPLLLGKLAQRTSHLVTDVTRAAGSRAMIARLGHTRRIPARAACGYVRRGATWPGGVP